MTILYLSLDGMTDQLGRSQVLPYLFGLSEKGYKITLISCEKQKAFEQQEKKIRQLIGSKLEWHPLDYLDKNGILSRQQNVKNIYSKAKELCIRNKVSIVHARSYPASLVALKLKRKFKIPFVFDMRGFWADERVEGGIWDLNKLKHRALYKYFKKKEIQLVEKSDHIVSLTQAAKDYMVKQFNMYVEDPKITVIPCCADLDHFNYASHVSSRKTTREKLGVKHDQKVILYAGSVGTWYLLDEMVDFFAAYLDKNPGSVFMVLTQNDHNLVKKTFSKKNIPAENYRLLSATREEMPVYIATADMALYFIKPVFSKMASSPVKLAEFMGCGLPVIANAGIGDVDEQAKQCNQIILVKNTNDKSYTETIHQLTVLKNDPSESRKFALENYSLEMGVERYNEIYSIISDQFIIVN